MSFHIPDSIISQKYCKEYSKQHVAIQIMKKRKSEDALLIARCKAGVYQYLIFDSINVFCEYVQLLHEKEKKFYMVYE